MPLQVNPRQLPTYLDKLNVIFFSNCYDNYLRSGA